MIYDEHGNDYGFFASLGDKLDRAIDWVTAPFREWRDRRALRKWYAAHSEAEIAALKGLDPQQAYFDPAFEAMAQSIEESTLRFVTTQGPAFKPQKIGEPIKMQRPDPFPPTAEINAATDEVIAKMADADQEAEDARSYHAWAADPANAETIRMIERYNFDIKPRFIYHFTDDVLVVDGKFKPAKGEPV